MKSRTQIAAPEYGLLVTAVAQKMAGPGRTPTARQHRAAEADSKAAMLRRGVRVRGGTALVDKLSEEIRTHLAGVSGIGGEEVGSFWGGIKDAFVSAVHSPVMPFVGPSAAMAVPIAAVLASKQSSKPKAAPVERAPVAESQASDDGTAVVGRAFVGSFVGRQPWGESTSSVYDRAIAQLSGADDFDYVFGDSGDLKEDEAVVYGECGGAAIPPNAPYYFPSFSAGKPAAKAAISPDVYRAGVMQRALKLSGGRPPSTKNLFDAQAQVDLRLQRAGRVVRIPGAQPGRVTR